MDDDDEAHSYPSPERRSHSPSPPTSGRITVSITAASAAAPSPPPPHQNSLTLALPIQQPSSRPPAAGGGGGREDCWSEGATAALIEAWGEKYLQLSRGNLKQNHWNEVADAVSRRSGNSKPPKTDAQCKNRIDTVKKKYKIEKAKAAAAGIPSRWPFFDRLDRLLSPSAAANAALPVGIPVGKRPSPATLRHHLQPPPHLRQHSLPPPVAPRFNPPNNSTRQDHRNFGRVAPPAADDGLSEDSGESLPPSPPERKRMKGDGRERKRAWGNLVRELTAAVVEFGEAYEAAESAKLQQMMEMEKQRMKFVKELELQRIKFMMKTQLEISRLCGGDDENDGRGGGSSGRGGAGGGGGGGGRDMNNHHHGNHVNHHDHVNSD